MKATTTIFLFFILFSHAATMTNPPPFSFSFLFFFFSSFDADDAGLVNRLLFRQFGLDFEMVFYSWLKAQVFLFILIVLSLNVNRLVL